MNIYGLSCRYRDVLFGRQGQYLLRHPRVRFGMERDRKIVVMLGGAVLNHIFQAVRPQQFADGELNVGVQVFYPYRFKRRATGESHVPVIRKMRALLRRYYDIDNLPQVRAVAKHAPVCGNMHAIRIILRQAHHFQKPVVGVQVIAGQDRSVNVRRKVGAEPDAPPGDVVGVASGAIERRAGISVNVHSLLVGDVRQPVQLKVARVLVVRTVFSRGIVPCVYETLRRPRPLRCGFFKLRFLRVGHLAVVIHGFGAGKDFAFEKGREHCRLGRGEPIPPPICLNFSELSYLLCRHDALCFLNCCKTYVFLGRCCRQCRPPGQFLGSQRRCRRVGRVSRELGVHVRVYSQREGAFIG